MSNKEIPKFIVVEGPDGSGKTTVVNYIAETLRAKGYEVVTGKGIGSGTLGEACRARLFNDNKPSVYLEAMAMATGLLDCFESFVAPNLEQGKIVILDRYVHSLHAYQKEARGLTFMLNLIEDLFYFRSTPNDVAPDITFYCDTEISVAENRLNTRGKENYLDEETLKFKQRVKDGYKNFFLIYGNFSDLEILDCNKSQEEVKQQINDYLF